MIATLVLFFVFWEQRKHPEGADFLQTADTVNVYLSKEKRVVRVPLESYVVGVVAAEMPADFHIESLKAQSLAARTYIANRLIKKQHLDPNEWGSDAKNADVSDTVKHQVYLTDDQLRENWGQDYSWKIKRIREAVLDTKGKIITYEDQPIYAAFFSTSNGWTENSEDYFQTPYPYLRSVTSHWDQASPKYQRQKALSVEQLVEELKRETGKQVEIKNELGDSWIRVLEKTEGNRVAKVMIGDEVFTGREVREALQLSSTDFRWKINKDHVLFETRGYGHGVGMSQWGANLMAKKGKKMEEIISHYYQNVKIVQWDSSST